MCRVFRLAVLLFVVFSSSVVAATPSLLPVNPDWTVTEVEQRLAAGAVVRGVKHAVEETPA